MCVSLAVLCGLSFATRPLVSAASEGGGARISVGSARGGGVLWAVLGGYRSLVADFAWLKAYIAWEKRDAAGCMSNIDLAAKLDPETLMFWHMGSGMIAYDMPRWIYEGRPHTPLQKRHVAERQARLAIDFLNRGLEFLPRSRRLNLDKALIYQKVLKDDAKELEAYEKAAEGDAPLFISRDYARRLEAAGRLEEALSVLRDAEKRADKSHPSYKFLEEHAAGLENKLRAQKNMLDSDGK